MTAFDPLRTLAAAVTLWRVAVEMTFRAYLEQRQPGDEDIRQFVGMSDPSILERRSWADLIRAFREAGADEAYIARARRLHHQYSRALQKLP